MVCVVPGSTRASHAHADPREEALSAQLDSWPWEPPWGARGGVCPPESVSGPWYECAEPWVQGQGLCWLGEATPCSSSEVSRKSATQRPLCPENPVPCGAKSLSPRIFPSCLPFSELPGAPTNLGISNIGPRSVTLQFKPGYDGKTSISRWLVEAQVRLVQGEPWCLGSPLPALGVPTFLGSLFPMSSPALAVG